MPIYLVDGRVDKEALLHRFIYDIGNGTSMRKGSMHDLECDKVGITNGATETVSGETFRTEKPILVICTFRNRIFCFFMFCKPVSDSVFITV